MAVLPHQRGAVRRAAGLVSQLIHGPTPRSPLRLSIRLRRSRSTTTEASCSKGPTINAHVVGPYADGERRNNRNERMRQDPYMNSGGRAPATCGCGRRTPEMGEPRGNEYHRNHQSQHTNTQAFTTYQHANGHYSHTFSTKTAASLRQARVVTNAHRRAHTDTDGSETRESPTPWGGKGQGPKQCATRPRLAAGCVAGVWTVADTQNTHTRAVSETGVICLPSQRKKFTPAHTPPPHNLARRWTPPSKIHEVH